MCALSDRQVFYSIYKQGNRLMELQEIPQVREWAIDKRFFLWYY